MSATELGATPRPGNFPPHHPLIDSSEVAPPGYENVVKGLKKNPSVDNPWAVAWWMKGEGISPKSKPKKTKARASEADGTPQVTGTIVEAIESTTMSRRARRAMAARAARGSSAHTRGDGAERVFGLPAASSHARAASEPPRGGSGERQRDENGRYAAEAEGEWDESKHPREKGRFTSKGGGDTVHDPDEDVSAEDLIRADYENPEPWLTRDDSGVRATRSYTAGSGRAAPDDYLSTRSGPIRMSAQLPSWDDSENTATVTVSSNTPGKPSVGDMLKAMRGMVAGLRNDGVAAIKVKAKDATMARMFKRLGGTERAKGEWRIPLPEKEREKGIFDKISSFFASEAEEAEQSRDQNGRFAGGGGPSAPGPTRSFKPVGGGAGPRDPAEEKRAADENARRAKAEEKKAKDEQERAKREKDVLDTWKGGWTGKRTGPAPQPRGFSPYKKTSEAMAATGMAPLLRGVATRTAPTPPGSSANPVAPNAPAAFPIQSFRDDVKRKEGIFASMHPSLGLQPKDVVNYRYSSDPKHACGTCAHYNADGSCDKVIGMIRAVDTCDLWEQKTAQSQAMKAMQQRLAPPSTPAVQPPQPGANAPATPVISSEAEHDESKHPRDEKGRFTSGGGGGATATADEHDPGEPVGPFADADDMEGEHEERLGSRGHHVETVDEAYRLLSEKQKVILAKPRMVSTLLDKLAVEAQKAREEGGELDINLCDVSVNDTNIFCAEHKGYSRVQMPQLAAVPTPGSKADKLPKDAKGEVNLGDLFKEHLRSKGIEIEETTVPANVLKASQNELDGEKVSGMMKAMEAGKIKPAPIFVSQDDYVVDGHHRWAATVGLDWKNDKADLTMPVSRIKAGILEVLVAANKYADDMGLPRATMRPKKPRKPKTKESESIDALVNRLLESGRIPRRRVPVVVGSRA